MVNDTGVSAGPGLFTFTRAKFTPSSPVSTSSSTLQMFTLHSICSPSLLSPYSAVLSQGEALRQHPC